MPTKSLPKISNDAIRAHNARLDVCANEHYNKAHRLGTWEERSLLRQAHNFHYGMLSGKLTRRQVDEYLRIFC